MTRYGPRHVQKALEFLQRERLLWPLWIFLGGLLLLLPRLGAPGFWEPQEIGVADRAQARIEEHSLAAITKTVSAEYRVREADLSRENKNEAQIDARNVALYLATKFTRETDTQLARAFGLTENDSIDSLVSGVAQRLDEPESALAGHVKAVETRLTKRSSSVKQTAPALTEKAIAFGLARVSFDEWGARLPLALLGLIALMLTFAIGQRFAGPRAGLLAALALMSFPLFVLQSRQLNSDIGAVAGSAMLVYGLIGLSWPGVRRQGASLGLYASDTLAVLVGGWLTYEAAGALLGLVPVLAAVALANIVALISERQSRESSAGEGRDQGGAEHDDHQDAIRSDERRSRFAHMAPAAIVAAVAAFTIAAWVFLEVFDFSAPIPGSRELFGKSLVPSRDFVEALGGVWKPNGSLSSTFDSLFEQIAFGVFPWAPVALLAIASLALGPRRGRRSWAGYLLFAWAMFAWAIGTVMTRKVGPVHYPAIVAVAVAVGMWLDDLLAARARSRETHEDSEKIRRRFGVPPILPLAGFFVAVGVVALAKDIESFTEKLTSLHVLGATVKYPKDMSLDKVILAMAMVFALAAFLGLWLWVRVPGTSVLARVRAAAGRFGLHVSLSIGVVFSLFLAQCWTPALSEKLSSKHLFSVYQRLKSDGDRLGVMGSHGSGPKYYAGDTFARIANRNELLTFLRRPERVFALVPAGELCPVHRAEANKRAGQSTANSSFEYHVLDDSHSSFLLMSNKLKAGERDRNPLAKAILRSKPESVGRPVTANYDNKIELIGVSMPNAVNRGSRFKVTIFFKVLKPISGTWKMFVHFDSAGMRFQGDHAPINGRCGTGFWQPGDFIVDTFWVEAGDFSYPKGPYVVRAGFFQGSHGNWKNMKVVSGKVDNNDRVTIGTLQVR